jgi:hypothetical protein
VTKRRSEVTQESRMTFTMVDGLEHEEIAQFYAERWGIVLQEARELIDPFKTFRIEGYMSDGPSWVGVAYICFFGEICFTDLLIVRNLDDGGDPYETTEPMRNRLYLQVSGQEGDGK